MMRILPVAFALGTLCLSTVALSDSINGLKLNLENSSVSGLSSGAYMAAQFHLANADWVKGIGMIAAGPYYCAQNNLFTALGSCINKEEPEISVESINRYIESQRESGLLSPLEQVKESKVWILHGTKDTKIAGSVSDKLAQQYSQWTSPDNMVYIKDKAFAHHFPTLNTGHDCDISAPPYIGNCGYDAAGAMLSHLLASPQKPAKSQTGIVHAIDQSTENFANASLGDKAYVYVPNACVEGEECGLHISFHGCNQYADAEGVGQDYIMNTGINRWADSNKLIVLYPQTQASMAFPMNPQGCWDWWGYTGEDYATKNGTQIKAVNYLVRQLMGD